jgi:solute carrier family 25 S-adenosylmethionine transporter 26
MIASITIILVVLCISGSISQANLIKSSIIQNKYFNNNNSLKKLREEKSRQETSTTLVCSKVDIPISLNAFDLCLCGALATVIGDFAMHPIDTIKIVQQSAVVAQGFFESAKFILKTSGAGGFYQGVGPYLMADGMSGAIKFATFEISKRFLETKLPAKFYSATQFVCAAGSMLACSFVLVPGEVLKTRFQTGAITSLFGGISTIFKAEGIKGFFAGYNALLVRDLPYTILELGLYENMKNAIRKLKQQDESTQTDELLAAAATGAIAAYFTTPLDLIKTKLMMEGTQYKGFLDAFRSIYAAGGVDALFVGSVARVAWLLPFTTIYLGVYEMSKRRLLASKKEKAIQAAFR